MASDEIPPTTYVQGRIIAFQYCDRFTALLNTGEITAVMPEELFSVHDWKIPLTEVHQTGGRLMVEVEMREPPALPKIVRAWREQLLFA